MSVISRVVTIKKLTKIKYKRFRLKSKLLHNHHRKQRRCVHKYQRRLLEHIEIRQDLTGKKIKQNKTIPQGNSALI